MEASPVIEALYLATSVSSAESGNPANEIRQNSRFVIGSTIKEWITAQKGPALFACADVEVLHVSGLWTLRKNGLISTEEGFEIGTGIKAADVLIATDDEPEDWGENILLERVGGEGIEWEKVARSDQDVADVLMADGYVHGLLRKLPSLKSLSWTSKMPFAPSFWPCLSPFLQNLDLDFGGVNRSGDFLKGLTDLTLLRTLKLTGMLPSWQNEIWKTAWKNPALETLELGSAWTPTFRGDGTKSWKFIDSDWKMPDIGATGVIEHLGSDGYGGCIHHNYGVGEYLDIQSIRHARTAATVSSPLSSPTRGSPHSGRKSVGPLNITRLKLHGFIVNASAFHAPELQNLRFVEFSAVCVDAGFSLTVETNVEEVRLEGKCYKVEDGIIVAE